jgi:hypothetical protein
MLRSEDGQGRQSTAPRRVAAVATSKLGVADITTTPGGVCWFCNERTIHIPPSSGSVTPTSATSG